MFTDPEAASDVLGATYSATSFNTAACCFAERDRGTATHSTASLNTAADAYRVAASYSGAAPVAFAREK
jgi:hypothetical protein